MKAIIYNIKFLNSKIIFKLKKFTVVFTLTTLVANTAHAENFIDGVMDDVLGNMTNVSSPGAYSAANRGVISGGSVYTRSKIFDPKLIAFTPPSWRGDCGGIDLFGGSFSFINSDQLVQLFRSIAANSVGLLFQMALQSVCSQCATIISWFQELIRDLNGLLSNSCSLAQGIVNTGRDLWNKKNQNNASLSMMENGFGDAWESFTGTLKAFPGTSPTNNIAESDPTLASEENIFGNLVWKAIQKNALSKQFVIYSDDTAEILMSVTGTVIVDKPKNKTVPSANGKADNAVSDSTNITTYDGTIDLQSFIEGSNNQPIKKLSCKAGTKDVECIDVTTTNLVIDGFSNKLYKALCGTSDITQICDGGAVAALSTNNGGSGSALGNNAEAVVMSLPNNIGTLIIQLATYGSNTSNPTEYAGSFIKKYIKTISLYASINMFNDMYRAVKDGLATQKGSNVEEAKKVIADNYSKLADQFNILESQYGSLNNLNNDYQQILYNFNNSPKGISQGINFTTNKSNMGAH